MALGGFKKTKDWVLFEQAINPKKFRSGKAKKIMDQGVQRAAFLTKLRISELIDGGHFERNADLTLELKKPQTKPLHALGEGESLKSRLVVEKVGNLSYFTGIKFTDSSYNIAVAIHDGTNIKVTAKMRNLFKLLWRASRIPSLRQKLSGRALKLWNLKPGGWKPLRDDTTHIHIPSRPFILRAFMDKKLIDAVKTLLMQAVQLAFQAEAAEAK